MTHKNLLLVATCFLSACSMPSTEREDKPLSCIDEFNFDHEPTYTVHHEKDWPVKIFSGWKLEKVPGTIWIACLPKNKTMYEAQFTINMNLWHKKPLWKREKYTRLRLPSSEEKEWAYAEVVKGGFFMSIVPIADLWEGTLIEWLDAYIGGTYPNGRTCASSKGDHSGEQKTAADYPAPHYIRYLSAFHKPKHSPGEFVKFEACTENGHRWAILIDKNVYLLVYQRADYDYNQAGDVLLQKILENLRVASDA